MNHVKSYQMIEVEILCLLLEGCAVHASSVGEYDFEDHLLKALQLPLDDVSRRPCSCTALYRCLEEAQFSSA